MRNTAVLPVRAASALPSDESSGVVVDGESNAKDPAPKTPQNTAVRKSPFKSYTPAAPSPGAPDISIASDGTKMFTNLQKASPEWILKHESELRAQGLDAAACVAKVLGKKQVNRAKKKSR